MSGKGYKSIAIESLMPSGDYSVIPAILDKGNRIGRLAGGKLGDIEEVTEDQYMKYCERRLFWEARLLSWGNFWEYIRYLDDGHESSTEELLAELAIISDIESRVRDEEAKAIGVIREKIEVKVRGLDWKARRMKEMWDSGLMGYETEWDVGKEIKARYDGVWESIMREVSKEVEISYADVERINSCWWWFVREVMGNGVMCEIRMPYLGVIYPRVGVLYNYIEKMGLVVEELYRRGEMSEDRMDKIVNHLGRLRSSWVRIDKEIFDRNVRISDVFKGVDSGSIDRFDKLRKMLERRYPDSDVIIGGIDSGVEAEKVVKRGRGRPSGGKGYSWVEPMRSRRKSRMWRPGDKIGGTLHPKNG